MSKGFSRDAPYVARYQDVNLHGDQRIPLAQKEISGQFAGRAHCYRNSTSTETFTLTNHNGCHYVDKLTLLL